MLRRLAMYKMPPAFYVILISLHIDLDKYNNYRRVVRIAAIDILVWKIYV